MSFNRIISASERAKPQFSPVHGKPEDNRDVLKEMALDMMRALTALVEDAGGDASYIEPYTESLVDDLNYAFAGAIDRASERDFTNVFKARPGLRNKLVEGARL